jgi:oxygen-independent coproporphyrinogen-3 oxidase
MIRHALYHLLSRLYEKTSPYGILTGTRPVKLVRKNLLKYGIIQLEEILTSTYAMEKKTFQNLAKIAQITEDRLINDPKSISFYISIPYCPSRCHYCTFLSKVCNNSQELETYLEYLLEDIKWGIDISRRNHLNIRSIYIGGGTPTILSANQLEKLMKELSNVSNPGDTEFTVEAGRPDTITSEKLAIMKRYGANRISINPQTMDDDTLQKIGRNHRSKDIFIAFERARRAGFNNINMDFINGLPGENTTHVNKNLNVIKQLRPENVTVHSLAIKKGSTLYDKHYVNQLDFETLSDMNQAYQIELQALEMEPYYLYRQKNIVGNMDNYGLSTPGNESLYNINIIEEEQTILGFGAGGVTKIINKYEDTLTRIPNNKDISTYAVKLKQNHAKIESALNTSLGYDPL